MSMTVAGRIIDFLGSLQGMGRLQPPADGARRAVIDLSNGAIIEAHPDYPQGERLLYERSGSAKESVSTTKLVKLRLTRHAFERSVIAGGSVKDNYQHAADDFHRKTGFGE
ncbi:hypothetical protein [Duganella vulcania]|uniref:Uncharacterized protein n=1 Tax=Duganella vulcania TaxID=2692166 RepID=A0A845GDX6_9BURK|nr:hypothetical protein [Duganella vulcania]MYM92484.1 hypothetical protein [Duganella vulcania]